MESMLTTAADDSLSCTSCVDSLCDHCVTLGLYESKRGELLFSELHLFWTLRLSGSHPRAGHWASCRASTALRLFTIVWFSWSLSIWVEQKIYSPPPSREPQKDDVAGWCCFWCLMAAPSVHRWTHLLEELDLPLLAHAAALTCPEYSWTYPPKNICHLNTLELFYGITYFSSWAARSYSIWRSGTTE